MISSGGQSDPPGRFARRPLRGQARADRRPLGQALGARAYLLASGLIACYPVAGLFGFIHAGIMPLYSVPALESFPMAMMGTIMGALGMADSLGVATGPLLGGFIVDTTGGCGGLSVACFGLGLLAFLIAMTVRPFPAALEAARRSQTG